MQITKIFKTENGNFFFGTDVKSFLSDLILSAKKMIKKDDIEFSFTDEPEVDSNPVCCGVISIEEISDNGKFSVSKIDVDESIKTETVDHSAINSLIMKSNVVFLKEEGIADSETVEERFVLSLVMEPTLFENGDMKPDKQGDVYTEKEVKKACYCWMENGGFFDLSHNWEPLKNSQIKILENYLAPVDFKLDDSENPVTVKKGSWLLGIRVLDDELWKACKSGALGAFSIGGIGYRTEI